MRRIGLQLIAALCAAVAMAMLSALVIALVDLYLVGHGRPGLLRESITWPGAGVHMSIGDVSMLALSFASAALAWGIAGRLLHKEKE